MKKTFLLAGLLSAGYFANAQIFNGGTVTSSSLYRDGKTGFGMTTAPSTNKVEIETSTADDGLSITQKSTTSGSRGASAVYLKNATGHSWGLLSTGTDNNVGGTHFTIYDITTSVPRFFISGSNGYVGIGTTTPSQMLDVSGNINASGSMNAGSFSTSGSMSAGSLNTSGAINASGNLSVGGKYSLTSTGTFKNSGWAGTGNRILLTDAGGNVNPLTAGSSSQVLYGNGAWGNLPATAFVSTGSDLNLASGKLGIGTSSPASALDVTGDARVSGTMKIPALVGGISHDQLVYVDASGNLKTTPVAAMGFDSPCNTGALPWYEGGNQNTTYNTIGTCDNVDFILKAKGNPMVWLNAASSFVGVGNSSPTQPLDVGANGLNTGINITQASGSAAALHLNSGNHWALFSTGSSNGQGSGHFSIYDYTANADRFFIQNSTGNVGVGTIYPNRKLSVDGDLSVGIAYGSSGPNGTNGFEIVGGGQVPLGRGISTDVSPTGGNLDFFINSWIATSGIQKFRFKNSIAGSAPAATSAAAPDIMTIDVLGQIAINNSYNSATDDAFIVNDVKTTPGTPIPNFKVKRNGSVFIGGYQNAGNYTNAMLQVNGTGVFTEVVVTQQNWHWPDYVFEKSYNLNNLEYVENYIKDHKHLPNVPSADDIKEKGLSIGEISKVQMEKIEELTLYIIELKKEIDALKKKQ